MEKAFSIPALISIGLPQSAHAVSPPLVNSVPVGSGCAVMPMVSTRSPPGLSAGKAASGVIIP
jgi:hypothetical protein